MAGPGFYGKHPGNGDFISAGLPMTAESHMVPWWSEVLTATREWLGAGWEDAWDNALPIRFWIGGAIWGGPHLRGVARPSRDKVGRRYPLFAVAETGGSPPMLQSEQRFYIAAEVELAADMADAADLQRRLAGNRALSADQSQPDAAVSASFWAVNPSLDVSQLLNQLDATDKVRAVGARSYWWVAAGKGRASAVLACAGMPGPGEMAWLLTGVRADDLTPQKVSEDEEDHAGGE